MSGKRLASGTRSAVRLSGALYVRVCRILESARTSAARSVNTDSVQNLRYMRRLYLAYPELTAEYAIRHAVRGELEAWQPGLEQTRP